MKPRVTSMNYEIPREAFKQRIEDRLNFVFVDLHGTSFENVEHMNYSGDFKKSFAAKYPNKGQNIIIYSLQKGDRNPEIAAQELADLGYHFVYYYMGSPDDVILDKGLN
jgi:hypothetical protein